MNIKAELTVEDIEAAVKEYVAKKFNKRPSKVTFNVAASYIGHGLNEHQVSRLKGATAEFATEDPWKDTNMR